MSHYTMLTILNKGEAKKAMAKARAVGAPGGTVLTGRGTASNAILALLGLGDSHKDLLMTVIEESQCSKVWDAFQEANVKGVSVLLDCVWKEEESTQKEACMEKSWEMIQVIAQDGFAEDIMAAARKAGAKGGTVLSGRGTFTEDDVQFFGSPLVQEKEVLMIVCESEKVKAIKDAITSLPFLKQKGVGVVFSMPVRDFRNLG